MLFSSYSFIFAFLPVALLMYYAPRYLGFQRISIFLLTLMSIFFYGWWNPIYLLLLIPLTLINFIFAKFIVRNRERKKYSAKLIFISGIAMNLLALGYFKYANFFVDNLNELFGADLIISQIVLPLGISFFTFQKIAFLVDAYRGKLGHLDFLDFSLFVSFFPQLIAGPIVHHSEVLPQFERKNRIPNKYIAMGITIFTIGLMKKVLLADTAALYASPQFASVASGIQLSFLAAWGAALAYTTQLYFDFSGYSDMAIGIALLFGIKLPVNFDSPYKAVNIIDFWRRWHITLSRFLRDYVYISLGGNRRGSIRRYSNLLLTMLLGGFWHGANWTFIVWGGLHGVYLVLNHTWHAIRKYVVSSDKKASGIEVFIGRFLTFIAVVIAWVFFRADSVGDAFSILQSMVGLHGLFVGYDEYMGLLVSFILLFFIWFLPNTQEVTGYTNPMSYYSEISKPREPTFIKWQPNLGWAIFTGIMFAVSIMFLSRISEFIYFQF